MRTQHQLNAAMNETASPSTAPELNSCPNCGWSVADEQVFQESILEYQQSLPEPSFWRKILRRISDGPVLLSDFWYFFSIHAIFSVFDITIKYYRLPVEFSIESQLFISTSIIGTAIISRFFYRKISDFTFRLRFENDLS